MSNRRYMVDIEGVGKMPGGVILSIGWCRFSPDGPILAEAGEVRLEIQPQLDAGLQVHGETLDWWLQQPALPWAVGTPVSHPHSALTAFNAAMKHAQEVWAKPPQYDLTGIQAAFKVFGISQSWPFRSERCFRTLKQLAPGPYHLPVLEEGVKHGAMADAIHQATEAAAMLKNITFK